jgi:hypothetical protein
MRQRLLMAALIGGAVVGTLGGIAYTNAATTTSPRPANYRAAVMRVLDAQGVDYRDVVVVDGCAPSYQICRTYAGSVHIRTETTLLGQITCRERWITCALTVQQAGITGAPLDDTIDPLAARWEEIYGQLMLHLREVYRSES